MNAVSKKLFLVMKPIYNGGYASSEYRALHPKEIAILFEWGYLIPAQDLNNAELSNVGEAAYEAYLDAKNDRRITKTISIAALVTSVIAIVSSVLCAYFF